MPLQTHGRFFLTRQSANIMEDLLRRLNQPGSISLLQGNKGVGKSRLLKQFQITRCGPSNSVFVQFNANNSFIVEQGKEQAPDLFYSEVLSRMKCNSILLIDQFEFVLPEIQQSIFKFWNNQATENNLKLVITAHFNRLQELTELSHQFHCQIDSVEVQPLTKKEQLDFLHELCCRDLGQDIVLPAKLKKNLQLTNGLFSQIEAFLFQYKDEISCSDSFLGEPGRFKKYQLYTLTGLIMVCFFSLFIPLNMFDTKIFDQHDVTVLNSNASYKQINLSIEPDLDLAEKSSDSVARGNTVVNRIAGDTKRESNTSGNTLSVDSDKIIDSPLSAQVSQILIEEPVKIINIKPVDSHTILNQRLQATKQWLDPANDKLASIQIMTIDSHTNPQQALIKYLDKLQSKGVDIEKIKIFPIIKNSKKIYGVLYGEFNSLNMAYREIKNLPDGLKANQPFPRTSKGINQDFDAY